MLVIIQLLVVLVISGSISQANQKRLRNTPSLNFTYYYYHEYPLPQAFEIIIGFSKTSDNFNQILLQLQQFNHQVRAEADKYNATVISNQLDKFANRVQIFIKETVQLDAVIEVHVRHQHQLVSFIDAAAKIGNAKVLSVDRVRMQKLNLQIEDSKAKISATAKSAQICSKFFGMSFKEIVVFDKIVTNEINDTTNDNETDNFVGDFIEVIDKIAEMEGEDNAEDDDAFFKCQIICYNLNYTPSTQKDGNQKLKFKKKIDSTHAEKIAKKTKSIQKSVQQPLNKTKSVESKDSKRKRQKQNQL